MEVKQLYSLVNLATKEVLGESAVVNEDLSNLVDVGVSLFNANAVDRYVKALVNQIGKVVFVSRKYRGSAPSVLMDGWEFGSILEKISFKLPDATENESWELEDGTSYDPNVFHKPTVEVKFFNSKVTFEIPLSITEMQVKQSFQSAEQLNGFISGLYNEVDKSMTLKLDGLIMRTINNFTAETVHDNNSVRYVKLLTNYNAQFGKNLTQAQAVTDKEFIRYSAYIMDLYKSRISKISTLYNIGGKARFTPDDMLHIVMLADFKAAADVYLQSDTYHNNFVQLPNVETVPYWQGSGTAYAFADVSNINVKTSSNNTVDTDGVIAVMFDRDALGVANMNKRNTSNYNPKAEFYNTWFKMDAQYFNDFNENFVVFAIK